jgi:hypothetical protein
MNLTWADLADCFERQRQFAVGYSPLYEHIFAHLAAITTKHAAAQSLEFDEQAIIDLLIADWRERQFSNSVEATLLLVGAMHATVLNEDREAVPISRFYATVGGSFEPSFDADVLRQMIGGLFLRPSETLRRFLRVGRVQTNEPSRGGVWVLVATILSAWWQARTAASSQPPITLIDLGCSAGLNLAADQQTWAWRSDPDGEVTHRLRRGDPLFRQVLGLEGVPAEVVAALPEGDLPLPAITHRVGIDLNPLRWDDPATVQMLRALIWGDQPARLERMERAIAVYQALDPAPVLRAGNIIEAAAQFHTLIAPETRLLLAFNSAVTVYFSDAEYAQLRANVAAAFRSLPDGVLGAWVEFESPRTPHAAAGNGFTIQVNVLQDGELRSVVVGYAEPHPQTITFTANWADVWLR